MKKHVFLLVICLCLSLFAASNSLAMTREEIVEQVEDFYAEIEENFGTFSYLRGAYPFEGIGVALVPVDGLPVLIRLELFHDVKVGGVWPLAIEAKSVFRGSSAENKLETGDLIFAVNGEEVGFPDIGDVSEKDEAVHIEAYQAKVKSMIVDGGNALSITVLRGWSREGAQKLTFQLEKTEVGTDFALLIEETRKYMGALALKLTVLRSKNMAAMGDEALDKHWADALALLEETAVVIEKLAKAHADMMVPNEPSNETAK